MGDQLTREGRTRPSSIRSATRPTRRSRGTGAGSTAEFKEKGDAVVEAAEKAAGEFHEAQGPDELKSASGTFNDSADEIVEDLKKMNEAAQNDNPGGVDDPRAKSLQNHGAENDQAATEIGATDCAGS